MDFILIGLLVLLIGFNLYLKWETDNEIENLRATIRSQQAELKMYRNK
jgi:hypothetical protein